MKIKDNSGSFKDSIVIKAFNFQNWTPNEEEWSRYLESLHDAKEVDRIQRFKRPDKNSDVWLTGRNNLSARASLAGRLMMISLTKRILQLPQSSRPIFKRTENEKPFLSSIDYSNSIDQDTSSSPSPVESISNDTIKEYNFNVSHAGQWTVIAGSKSIGIGIDVMEAVIPNSPKTTFEEYCNMLKSCFTDFEWSNITKSPKTKTYNFFQHWCLKESYIKAVGVGLSLDLTSIEFHNITITQ
eukprot:gene4169-5218_t